MRTPPQPNQNSLKIFQRTSRSRTSGSRRPFMEQIIRTIAVGLITFFMVTSPAFAQSPEDEKLSPFFKSYLEQLFQQQPLDATMRGDHRFDNRLDDISPAARAGWLTLSRDTLKKLPQAVDYKKLSRDGQVDFEIFQHNLEAQIWETENEQPFEQDPRTYGHYISDSVYALLTHSTLPKETNIANCLARMAEIPRIIAEAQRSLTHPSKPITGDGHPAKPGERLVFTRKTCSITSATRHSRKNSRTPLLKWSLP